jgi:hypothetical protein
MLSRVLSRLPRSTRRPGRLTRWSRPSTETCSTTMFVWPPLLRKSCGHPMCDTGEGQTWTARSGRRTCDTRSRRDPFCDQTSLRAPTKTDVAGGSNARRGRRPGLARAAVWRPLSAVRAPAVARVRADAQKLTVSRLPRSRGLGRRHEVKGGGGSAGSGGVAATRGRARSHRLPPEWLRGLRRRVW